jgi:hypothetical protein
MDLYLVPTLLDNYNSDSLHLKQCFWNSLNFKSKLKFFWTNFKMFSFIPKLPRYYDNNFQIVENFNHDTYWFVFYNKIIFF